MVVCVMPWRDKAGLASSVLLVLLLAPSITRTRTQDEEGDAERLVAGEYLDQHSCRDGRVLVPLADVSFTDAYKSEIRRNEAEYRKDEKLMGKNCKSKRCSYDWTGKLSDFVCIPKGKCTICFGEPGTLVAETETSGATALAGIQHTTLLFSAYLTSYYYITLLSRS